MSVELPDGISMDEAYSGEQRPADRPLHALERDILCRILDDIFFAVAPLREWDENGQVEITDEKCRRLSFKDPLAHGGIRMSPYEVAILFDVHKAINPRGDDD